MEEKIRIKCPGCGAVLVLKNGSASDDKMIVCPRCKSRNRLGGFTRVVPAPQPVVVENDTFIDQHTRPASAGFGTLSMRSACLVDTRTGKRYPLREGRNLIGRRTYQTAPLADVPIDTPDMGMSRAHFYVEMVRVNPSLSKVYMYNANNKNHTYVNADLVSTGDKIVLHNGDVIRSSETVLKFICD